MELCVRKLLDCLNKETRLSAGFKWNNQIGGKLGKFECEQDINSLKIFKCILLLNLCKRMFLILGNAHSSI